MHMCCQWHTCNNLWLLNENEKNKKAFILTNHMQFVSPHCVRWVGVVCAHWDGQAGTGQASEGHRACGDRRGRPAGRMPHSSKQQRQQLWTLMGGGKARQRRAIENNPPAQQAGKSLQWSVWKYQSVFSSQLPSRGRESGGFFWRNTATQIFALIQQRALGNRDGNQHYREFQDVTTDDA